MKIRALLAGVALGAIAVVGLSTGAQARFGIFIDSGDYWRSHHYDYCYYHDCGDSWYLRHHRHFWRDRDYWRGDRGGDWRHHDHGGDWHGDHHDGDWNDDGHHHHHHDD